MAQTTIKGLVHFIIFLLMLPLASAQSSQCPNNLAVYNPNLRTACVNGTFFIVPVDIATVQDAVAPYNLVPLPTSDETLFPNGFPAGTHPVLVEVDMETDIRMSALQIPTPLLSGSIQVPYVDRLGDGETGFLFSVDQYIGGYDGNDVSGYVPALVGSLGGTTIFVASFVPDDGPYEEISTSPPEFIAQIKDIIVPNPVSGPAVIEEAIDTDFFTVSDSSYTAHTFHEFISQPLILTNGLCQRNPIYFNQTFTDPVFRNGSVTLYSPGGAFAGVYDGVQGYSASGETVGYNAETCSSAAANTDPMALA